MEEEQGYTQEEESSELYEHFRFEADKGQSLIRIDKFLVDRLENASRSKIQSAAGAGNILVNGKAVKSNYKVKPLDLITIVLPHPPRELELMPENIPLDILFEDETIIVVNKPPGLVVHPGHGNYTGTLVNALMYHLKDAPLFKTGEIRPGLVHRIDKNTSGILVIAKTEYALNHLAQQFFNRTTDRLYQAIVWGNFEENEGTVTGNIARHLNDRMKMAVFPNGDHGKHAVTHYKLLERLGYISLIECKLETGRTHQIRVHMEYIKHPIFNDDRYGGDQILKGTTYTKYKQFVHNCFQILPRHGLHARSLGFVHPVTNENMMFETPLPEDMSMLLDKWRRYVSGRDLQEEV